MGILHQFLLRLSFGLALGMAITSPRQVAAGYFRTHLYVTLGLTTLATLIGFSSGYPWWASAGAMVASYVGSVCWLYEKPRVGVVMLWLVAALSLLGAWLTPLVPQQDPWHLGATATSGLLLGLPMAAMLLGHWYLNVPGMELAPLRCLLIAAGIAVGLRAVVSGAGLVGLMRVVESPGTVWYLFLLLRWVAGIVGLSVLLGMAWQTLRVPNTQSATGILYVAVIAAFTGELASLLLSVESVFPL